MYGGVENIDVIDDYYFMNSHTLSKANNHISIDSKNERDENVPNVSELEYTRLYLCYVFFIQTSSILQ